MAYGHLKFLEDTKFFVAGGAGFIGSNLCEALMAGHDATLEVADDILQDAINNHVFVCILDRNIVDGRL